MMADTSPLINEQEIRAMETDLPFPKYRIGQTVYRASTHSTTEMYPCPDCLGTRKWKVTTPAGAELTTDCIRCHGCSGVRGVPPLTRQIWKPEVRTLTVGAVEASQGWGSRSGVKYMAKETGLGSGAVYDELDLHPDQDAAFVAAEAKAAAENARLEELPSRIDQFHFAKLQIADASIKAANDVINNSWYRLNTLVGEIKDILQDEQRSPSTAVDLIRDEIEFDREYRADRDPLDKLVSAARHAVATTDLPELASALAEPPFSLAATRSPAVVES